MSLVINALNKTYGKNKVLKDVSFDIKKGEIVALIGQNGAGKSTIIHSILGFCNYSGDIIWCSDDMGTLMQRKKLGYSPEELIFNDGDTVEHYLKWICHLKRIHYGCDAVKSMIEALELQHSLTIQVSALSKGMKRKLIYLQAVIGDPELLILDEPTDGLDPIARNVVLQHIKKMAHTGTAVLLTSHLLYDIQILCDKIIIIRNGKVLKILEKEAFSDIDLYKEYHDLVLKCEAEL